MGALQSLITSGPVQGYIKDARVPDDDIRQAILSLLVHCRVAYTIKPYDQSLHDRCLALCEERGYHISPHSKHDANHKQSLLRFLPTGVYITLTSYDHLKPDLPRLTYIALYSTFMTYMDDLFKHDVENGAAFGRKLLRGEKQGHPILDGLADLLNDAETFFGPTAAAMIVQDTLAFFSCQLVEYETQGLHWLADAIEFPSYIRALNAGAVALTMFIFPTDIPLKDYIQAVPGIRDYICYSNDVLSFYKEEARGEDDTYIALVSASQKISRNDILQKLAIDVGRTTARVDKVLSGNPAALNAWSSFKAGYIYYHTSNPRYKLDHFNFT